MKYPSLAILIPIYKEKERLLRQNREVFQGLKYPGEIQVYWLLHDSDEETIDKVIRVNSDLKFTVIIDDLEPPLKANALNNALKHVKEEVIAVFDVDSVVSSDYVRKMVSRLVGNKVALVQGTVLFYNADKNWLTRWQEMTAESWFFFRWLSSIDTKGWFPLGGTGYFIWKKELEEIGGFPLGLTEDIGLSTGLYAHGKKMLVFEKPYYYEECPETLLNLIRQQARWRKGWIQNSLRYKIRQNFPKIWAYLSEVKWSSIAHSFAVISIFLSLISIPILLSLPFWAGLTLGIIIICHTFTIFCFILILPYIIKRKHWTKITKLYGLADTTRWFVWGILALKGWIELKIGYKPLGWYHTKKKGIKNLWAFLKKILKR